MLELQTFDGLTLRTGAGERIEALAGRTKCLALLAYLAVEAPDAPVPREQVAALLWPDRTDELSRNSLRSALSQIRQATDPVLLAGKGTSTLGLIRDHLRADVTAFREALEAGEEGRVLELYKGNFLAGVRVEGARSFRRWADRKRGQFRQQAYEAALSVGTSARQAGDLASAEAAFRRALDLAPLREEAAAKLIRALAERGRPSDALQLYETFRERRETELEMAPSEELDELVERIRAGEVEPRGADAEGPAKAGQTPEPTAARPEDGTENGGELADSSGAGEPEATETRGRFWGVSTVSPVAVLALVLVAVGLWRWEITGSGDAALPAAADHSVAVLPFEVIGTDEPGPIAEGLHTDLLSRLSNVSGLKVISGTSVERFRGAKIPLPAMADSLGAGWVVEGEVQQSVGAIQVNAQLIDPRSDAYTWAETYRRELTAENLFDLQSEITKQIARSLEAELTPAETERVERRPTGDLDAYRLYVRGRRLLDRRTAASIREAVDYFQRAITHDSSYALAWSGLADAIGVYPVYGPDSVPPSLPEHEEAALRAVELDPELAEAHASMGLIHFQQHNAPATLRDVQRAVELKPSYAQAHHWLGLVLFGIRQPEAAYEHLSLAVELNPQHDAARGVLVNVLVAQGDLEAAEQHLRRRKRFSGRPHIGQRGLLLYHTKRWGELEALAREHVEHVQKRFFLARILAQRGDTAAAREHLAELRKAKTPADQGLVYEGLVHAALGEADAAFSAWTKIESLVRSGGVGPLRYWFSDVLAPLRDDPRYEKLIRKFNQRWDLNPDGSLPDSADVSFEGHPDD